MRASMSDRSSDDAAITDDGFEIYERSIRGMPVMEPDPEVPTLAVLQANCEALMQQVRAMVVRSGNVQVLADNAFWTTWCKATFTS